MNAKKYEHVNKLLKSRQKVFNAFKSEVFTVKSTQVKGIEILTLKKITGSTCTSKSR